MKVLLYSCVDYDCYGLNARSMLSYDISGGHAINAWLKFLPSDTAENQHFDMNKAIEEFAGIVANVYHTKVSWICTDGNHTHLKTRKIYQR